MKEEYICPDIHFLIAYCFYNDSEALFESARKEASYSKEIKNWKNEFFKNIFLLFHVYSINSEIS